MQKPKKVVIDTNIVIFLSRIANGVKINKSDREIQSIDALLKAMVDGKVEFIVTPRVVVEIEAGNKKDGGFAFNFMKKYCELAEFSDEQNIECYRLAKEYGKGENPAIPGAHYETQRNFYDALILAQSAVLGLTLITNNVMHFFNGKEIRRVNLEQGYTNSDLKVYSSQGFVCDFGL